MTMTRVGLIVPSSNTVVEPDFFRELPAEVSLHSARMFLVDITAEAERVMVTDYLPQAVADIASVGPDVVAFACTSAGAVLGADGEARLIAEIEQATGAVVVSTNDAVGRYIEKALSDLSTEGSLEGGAVAVPSPQPSPKGRGSIAVITPYVDELNLAIRAGLERRGLRVAHIAGLGLLDNPSIAAVTPSEIVEFAEAELASVDFDLLFVSCTNFRGYEARASLMERFGVPVVTSNQATLEAVVEALC